MNTEEKPICGYGPLAEFLTDHGFKTSKSFISKICSPAVGNGPPIEGYWGKFPLFLPSRSLTWARARVRPGRAPPGDVTAAPDDRSHSAGLPARAPLPLTSQTERPAPGRRGGPHKRATPANAAGAATE
jgi:hypothetical protein